MLYGMNLELDAIESEILRLVSLLDGEWYWYQIDRFISDTGTRAGPFMPKIKALLDAGLIEQRENPALGGTIQRYWLTEKGREKTKKN